MRFLIVMDKNDQNDHDLLWIVDKLNKISEKQSKEALEKHPNVPPFACYWALEVAEKGYLMRFSMDNPIFWRLVKKGLAEELKNNNIEYKELIYLGAK
jgi:hypothetical protein